jgi:hypothetical protein
MSLQPVLKPQDVIVAIKLAVNPDTSFTYARAAFELGLQPSRIHASVGLIQLSRLGAGPAIQQLTINRLRLADTLIYGVPTIFPAKVGAMSRGMRTAEINEIVPGHFSPTDEMAYVWPDPNGKVRGVSVTPLHPCVLVAASNDSKVKGLLIAIDVCRTAAARERKIARDYIRTALE